MNKQLLFNEDARRKIQEGIDVVANAVKVTLGPKGRNVILDQEYGQPHITKDGVSVAKEIELNAQAEAESISKVGRAKAEAESLNIAEIGRAKAEAAQKLAEAYKEYGQQAIMLELLKVYPEIVKNAAEPISNIDKITIIDGGEGKGVSQVSGYTTRTLASIQESLKETLGLDVSELINSYVGNHNVGSKLSELNETLQTQPDLHTDSEPVKTEVESL